MNYYKIGTVEAIALVCIVMTNHIIINIPESIIQSTGSASWINVLFISLISIIFTLIICKLFKNFTGKDILDISEYAGRKSGKSVYRYCIYYFICITIKQPFAVFCIRSKINILS